MFPAPNNTVFKVGTTEQALTTASSAVIPHGLGAIPKFVALTNANAASAVAYFVSWDATNITVTFGAAFTGTFKADWFTYA